MRVRFFVDAQNSFWKTERRGGMKKLNLVLLVVVVMLTMVCVSKTAVAKDVGNYPGKWYGWWCPFLDPLPPQAGTIKEVENQKIIKSWGYKTGNSFEEIKDLVIKPFYEKVLQHPESCGDYRINETAYIPPYDKAWLEATEKYKGTAYVNRPF